MCLIKQLLHVASHCMHKPGLECVGYDIAELILCNIQSFTNIISVLSSRKEVIFVYAVFCLTEQNYDWNG